MNYIESVHFIRNAIIESHDVPQHLINRISITLNNIDNEEGLGLTLDSFDPELLSTNLSEKLSYKVYVSWCDSIDDIVNNYNDIFNLVSPN